jgi:hypothetical protein
MQNHRHDSYRALAKSKSKSKSEFFCFVEIFDIIRKFVRQAAVAVKGDHIK